MLLIYKKRIWTHDLQLKTCPKTENITLLRLFNLDGSSVNGSYLYYTKQILKVIPIVHVPKLMLNISALSS